MITVSSRVVALIKCYVADVSMTVLTTKITLIFLQWLVPLEELWVGESVHIIVLLFQSSLCFFQNLTYTYIGL